MSNRVQEILSWYGADNPGTLANLYRIIMHGRLAGTGKFVILPVDQGFEHGPARSFAPNPAGYDPRYHFKLAIDAGCNAYAAPLGFIEAGAREYAGQIPLILKANNSDSMYGGSDPIPAVTASVDDALRLGCAAIGFTIYPGSAARNEMYEEIREIAADAKDAGLAVVIWSYPRGSGISKAGETAVDIAATPRRSPLSSARTSSSSSRHRRRWRSRQRRRRSKRPACRSPRSPIASSTSSRGPSTAAAS